MRTIFVLSVAPPASLRDSCGSRFKLGGTVALVVPPLGGMLPTRSTCCPGGTTRVVRRACLAVAGLVLVWAISSGNSNAWSATLTWSSTAAGTSWNDASNWGGTVPGSVDIGLFAAASYASQPALTSTAATGGIWDTGSGAVTIGGTSALTLFGTTINSNPGTGIEVDAVPGRSPSTRRWPCRTTSNGSTIRPAHLWSTAPSAVPAA